MKTQIKINHLSKTFNTLAGPKKALDDVSLEIAEGECVVIGGENGSGKSVLMQIIAGLMDGDKSPETVVSIQPLRGHSTTVGLVFQEAETQILGETPAEDIAFGPKNLGWKKADVQAAVREALEQTGLTELAGGPPPPDTIPKEVQDPSREGLRVLVQSRKRVLQCGEAVRLLRLPLVRT